jgi:hypothetical protein
MQVVIKGDHHAPQEKVPTATIPKTCNANKKGCFHYKSNFDVANGVVTITFTAHIYLDSSLKGNEVRDVLTHETQHFTDFKFAASSLKAKMQKSLQLRKQVSDPELQNWLDWFDYDCCVATATFHRRIGAMVDICFEPNTPRPE